MKLILSNLNNEVKKIYKNADETWTSVALMTLNGFKQIFNKNSINNILVGTYLPTEPSVLKELLKIKNNLQGNIGVFTNPGFHPKVYIARKKNKYTAIIGSSNCTIGGLINNTEVNYFITSINEINSMVKWYDEQFTTSKELNNEFIDKYEKVYLKRKKKQKEIERIADEFDSKSNTDVDLILTRKKQLVKRFMTWKKTKEFKEILTRQNKIIKNYRKNLDYPRLSRIDISPFVSKYELGHTHGLNVPEILKQKNKFIRLVNYLADDKIPIQTRYYEARHGKYHVSKIAKGIISKILIVLFPNKYPVLNNESYEAIQSYGFKFPRTANSGIKYKSFSDAIEYISKNTGIKNRAVIDYFLYFKAI